MCASTAKASQRAGGSHHWDPGLASASRGWVLATSPPPGQLPAKPAQGPWVESRWLHGRSAACPPLLPHSMADKNGALKCTFSAPGHSTSLLQGLAMLRAQGQLLDIMLTVNRETFHAHKVVLAACSDYFRCAGPRCGVGAPPVPEGPSQGCASSCIQPRMALRERG